MGVMPKMPNIVIAFEYVSQGSLFNLLHMKKGQVNMNLELRLRIAKDIALAFFYMYINL